MTDFVLDSSVILAVLRTEPGHETISRYAIAALISSVNLAEIVTKCVEHGIPPRSAVDYVTGSNIDIIDFNFDDAILAGRLQSRVPKGVLSLGDRACLATAIRFGLTAVTADRVWATLDVGCPVKLIR
jgi:PIN domain nuclease of toxin-antitoxin system